MNKIDKILLEKTSTVEKSLVETFNEKMKLVVMGDKMSMSLNVEENF